MNKKEKKFDAVIWVRQVRDKFYEEHRNLKGQKYIEAIRNEARKSKFWTEKNEKEVERLREKSVTN